MPERRPTYIRFQNWKKTIAGAIVILFHACLLSQIIPVPKDDFLDNRNGLSSHISRKTRIDEHGTAWIATDAGLNIIPENPEVHQHIINTVGALPIWDIHFYKNLIFIGTHDSLIFVFNKSNSQLVRKIKFSHFRRFREFNGFLFALGSEGVIEISGGKPQFWFETKKTVKKSTVMDLVYWQNRYFLFQFGVGHIFSSKDGLHWSKDESIVGRELLKSDLVPVTSKSLNNILFVGLESNQYKIFYDLNSCDSVVFAQRPKKSFCIWDMDSDKDKMYIALGNHVNFDEGSVIVHKLDNKKNNQPYELQPYPFIWGIAVDTLNNGIWLNSIVSGAKFIPDIGKRFNTPVQFNNFISRNNHKIGWAKNILYIKSEQKDWQSFELPYDVKKCFYAEDSSIWIQAEKGIYRLKNSELTLISPKFYHFAELVGDYLYVCEYFYHVNAIHLKTLEIHQNIHPKLKSIITIKPLDNRILAQTETNGYFLIENLNAVPVKIDQKIPKAKNNFYLSGNLMIMENGKELVFHQFDSANSNFKPIHKVNLSDFFPNQKIDWVYTNLHGIWVFTNQNIIQIAFKNPTLGLKIINQYYLGYQSQINPPININSEGIYVISGKTIDFIPFNGRSTNSFKGTLKINLKPYQFFKSSIAGRVWKGTNFKIEINSPKYIQFQNGYTQIEITNEQGQTIRQFIHPNNEPIWINDLEIGIYQIKFFNGFTEKNIVFRVNVPITSSPAIWFLVFMGVGLLIFVLVFNQKERFNLTEKLLSMELATLKNNMNPHFIFNTMNLIQSLIVRSNVKQALKATSELAKLNRLFLETSNKDFIYLDDEIQYAKKYVGLEQMRFESDHLFQFQIFTDENLDLKSWFIPPLILQPLLENAIKHGALMSQESSIVTLNLDLVSPHLLLITVRNEINKKRKTNRGTQIGLKLVRDRLNLIQRKYPNLFEFSLNIEPSPKFFTVAITIKRLDQNWIYE